MISKWSKAIAVGVFILFLSTGWFFGQQAASISGTITDPSGAVVPGARVTAVNTGTGASRTAVTTSAGFYSIQAVEVGTYNVTVRAKGFKVASEAGVQVHVDENLALNLQLQLGSTTQTVTVSATAAHLQTNNATVSQVISGKQIQSIAVNGRNFDQLALLVPGASSVANNGFSGISHLGVGGFGFNGIRGSANAWYIDGSPDVDPGSRGSLDTSPAMDSVSQFRVVTSNGGAQYGGGGGAVISVRLKSGTNHFHGSAYEYARNDALDARQALPYSIKKVPLSYNDFGFTFGGPVVRKKLFFFYSSEWRKLHQGTTVVDHTPTQLELAGNFSQSPLSGTTTLMNPTGNPSCVTGDQISSSCFDPNAVALLKGGAFPSPNAPGFDNYTAAPSLPSNFNQELFRVDYDLSSKWKIMVHFIREGASKIPVTSLWSGSDFPTISDTFATPSANVAVRLTHLISPTLLNVINFGFTDVSDIGTPTGAYMRPSGYTTPTVFAANPDNRVPQLSFNLGYTGIDAGRWPYSLHSPVYNFRDTYTKTFTTQNLTWGGEYTRGLKNQPNACRTQGSFRFNGRFTGNPLADFLLGYPSTYSECSAEVTGKWRYNQAAAFAQDNWHASKRLTVDAGVRYYFIPHTYADNGVTTWLPSLWDPKNAPTLNSNGNVNCTATYTFYPQSSPCNMYDGIFFAGTPNAEGIGKNLTRTYYFNFGPRIGLAWQLPGVRKTVLRTGYGRTYYRIQGNDTYNLIGNPPIVQNVSYTNSATAPVKLLDNPAAGTVPPVSPLGLFVLDQHYKIPTYQQYSLGVQHMFGSSTILTVSYVGTHGTHIWRTINANLPRPTTVSGSAYDFNPALNANAPANLYRPYTGFGSITMNKTDTNSDYNSLQVNFDKEMSHNLRFQAVYTYARGHDNDNGSNRCVYNRKSCWAQDQGHSNLLVVNYIYNLPFFKNERGIAGEVLGGWRWAGVTTFASGEPFSVGITGSHLGLTQFPDVTGPISYPKTRSEWFNTKIFSTPAVGHYGKETLNQFYGPNYTDWDMSFSKGFSIVHRIHARLKVDFFNIFNNVNLALPHSTFGSRNFGEITSSESPRIIQVGVHGSF